ncbi:MAG: 1,4-alpha-glucan branching protein GlgB, partial [Actinomycetota bacterium]
MILRRKKSAENLNPEPIEISVAESVHESPINAVDFHELERIVEGRHHDPHGILGAHLHKGHVVFRTIKPFAISVVVVSDGIRLPLTHEHRGIWVGALEAETIPDYRIESRYDDEVFTNDDAYRFLPTLGEMDLHLIREGRHEQLADALGARVVRYDSPLGQISGTSFAVWAPNAQGVQVVGDFNHWDGTAHPMRSLGSSGVWEVFIPGVGHGYNYKFRVTDQHGYQSDKADPLARHSEVPPSTASIVWESSYEWQDNTWIEQRSSTDNRFTAMSIYEVHLGSWRLGLGFRDVAIQLRDYVLDHGFTHVEFMPLAQHP